MAGPAIDAPDALSADVVAAIDDLELAARLVVEGARAGSHRSPFHGYSAEFQVHRPYRAGDDLKHLDWKLLARTDRLYSRVFREATSMPVMLVLDTSASMDFPAPGVSKFRTAVVLAAALAYLVSSQGDAVGLMTTAGERLQFLPARGGRAHLRALLARLTRATPGGSWQPDRAIGRSAELLARRGVVVVLSDFYDGEESAQREMRRVLRRGHDLAMLQLTSPEERDFPFAGALEFEDLETGRRTLVDAGAAAASHRAGIAAFHDRLARQARRDGIDHALIATDQSPGEVLRRWLLRRGARHGSAHEARRQLR